MPSISAGLNRTRGGRHRAIFIPLLLACICAPGLSVTIDSHDFGLGSIGTPSSQQILVPAVTAGPATFSLRYSIDYSLGACTPNANGCLLSVTFDPTRPGLRQDAVIVKDANGQVVEEVLLHGIGLGPMPVFSPALTTLEAFIPGQSSVFQLGIAGEPDAKILTLSAGIIYEFDPATNTIVAVPGLPTPSGFTDSIYELATDAAGNILLRKREIRASPF